MVVGQPAIDDNGRGVGDNGESSGWEEEKGLLVVEGQEGEGAGLLGEGEGYEGGAGGSHPVVARLRSVQPAHAVRGL